MATTERTADLIFLLSQAAHALTTELTAELEGVGITPRSHCVLTHALEGDQTQIQLAERCALDKTTMVGHGRRAREGRPRRAAPLPHRPARADHRGDRRRPREGGAGRPRSSTRIYADVLASLPADERVGVRGRALAAGRRRAWRSRPACDRPVRRRSAADRSELDRLLLDHLLRSSNGPTTPRAPRALRRDADDHPRPDDRERRAAGDPARPRLLGRRPRLGRQRVPDRLRRPAPARRPPRRPRRPPPRLPRRAGRLHRRVAAVRSRRRRRRC